MLKENQIFIHVPKTGGTTLNCALYGTEVPKHADFNFRHIVAETKMSNSADIFNPIKNEQYKRYQIFMMLRHPLDRIISEYYFIKERDEFFSLLKPSPKNFEEYALHRQTANYVVSFLLGNRIYANVRPERGDLNLVKNAIEDLNIRVGIYEDFKKSLAYFESSLNLKWPKIIESKRVTIRRPKQEEISSTLRAKILAHHELDLKLYEFALNRFNEVGQIKVPNYKITDNRYDFVLIYTNKHFLLELVLKDHFFISANQEYFNALRKHLFDLKLTKGDEYLDLWLKAFINALLEIELPSNLKELLAKSKFLQPMNFIEEFGKLIVKLDFKELKKLKLTFSASQIPQSNLINNLLSLFRIK